MSTPNFLESHVSQIPAIQLLQQLGFTYVRRGKIEGGNCGPAFAEFDLEAGNFFSRAAFNRPATPLHDAQLGGYFFGDAAIR